MTELCIHIVPVGYDVYTRVTIPLNEMRADKVYFLRHEKGTIRGHDKFFSKIKKEIRKTHTTFEEIYIDIWDLYKCIEILRSIITKESKKKNKIFVNVSTGTKITAMAGVLVCMMLHQTPYYVRLKNPVKKGITRIPYVAVKKSQNVPTFEIKKPDGRVLKILDKISKSKYKMLRKWELTEFLEAEGDIKQINRLNAPFSVNAKLSQLKTILEPIQKYWKYITVESRGSRSEVKITDEGEKALQIFGISNI